MDCLINSKHSLLDQRSCANTNLWLKFLKNLILLSTSLTWSRPVSCSLRRVFILLRVLYWLYKLCKFTIYFIIARWFTQTLPLLVVGSSEVNTHTTETYNADRALRKFRWRFAKAIWVGVVDVEEIGLQIAKIRFQFLTLKTSYYALKENDLLIKNRLLNLKTTNSKKRDRISQELVFLRFFIVFI